MPRLTLLVFLLAPLTLQAQPSVTAWAPLGDDTDWSRVNCLTRLAERVCRQPNEDSPGFTFTLSQDAREVARWESDGWLHTGFRVFSLDRDEEGASPEHVVVANLGGVSNGLGVAYWTLYVLAEAPEGPALRSSIPVQEFGPDGGSFDVDDDGLVLWATEWLQGPDPSGRRTDGLYFVGRPFRFEDGRPVPAADLPVRARRFLDSFADERAREDPATPAAWLSHPSTETRLADPLLGGEEPLFSGIVEAVAPQEAEFGAVNWQLRLRPDDGAAVVYTYAFGYSEGIERPFTVFGDAASGRLYPPGYLAADPAAWLTGRRVRAASYAGGSEPRVVLWLE